MTTTQPSMADVILYNRKVSSDTLDVVKEFKGHTLGAMSIHSNQDGTRKFGVAFHRTIG